MVTETLSSVGDGMAAGQMEMDTAGVWPRGGETQETVVKEPLVKRHGRNVEVINISPCST